MHRFLRKTFFIVLMAALLMTAFTSCENAAAPVSCRIRMFDGEEKKPFLEYDVPAGVLITVPERTKPDATVEKVTAERRDDMKPGDQIVVVSDTDFRYQWKKTHWKVEILANYSTYIRTDYVKIGDRYTVPDIKGDGEAQVVCGYDRLKPGDEIDIKADSTLDYQWVTPSCMMAVSMNGGEPEMVSGTIGSTVHYSRIIPKGEMVTEAVVNGKISGTESLVLRESLTEISLKTVKAGKVEVYVNGMERGWFMKEVGDSFDPVTYAQNGKKITSITDRDGNSYPVDQRITVNGDMLLDIAMTELCTVTLSADQGADVSRVEVLKGDMFDPSVMDSRIRTIVGYIENGVTVDPHPVKIDADRLIRIVWSDDAAQFEWEELPDGSGIRLTSLVSKAGEELVIPPSIGGKPVKELGDYLFSRVGRETKKIILPSSLERIGRSTFISVDITELDLPAGISEIPDRAFSECRELLTINHRGRITKIGDYAFYSCAQLSGLDLSNAIEIGAHAFDSSGITLANLSSELKAIPEGAFRNCSRLDSVSSGTVLSKLRSIGVEAFYKSAVTSVYMQFCSGNVKIGENAFRDCTGLTYIDIGSSFSSSVHTLCSRAFSGCTALSNMVIGNNRLRLDGIEIFDGCKNLKTVPWKKLDSIHEKALVNFTGLEDCTIKLPEGAVISLAGCTGLKNLTLDASITSTDCISYAPYVDTLTTEADSFRLVDMSVFHVMEAHFNGSHLVIGRNAYSYSGSAFKPILYIPQDTELVGMCFEGKKPIVRMLYDPGCKRKINDWNQGTELWVIYGNAENSIEGYDVPDSMFAGSSDLVGFIDGHDTENVWMYPASVGNEAFRGCSGLTDIDLSECASIGSEAFRGCTGIKEADLSACRSIGWRAFDGWTGEQKLTGVPSPVPKGWDPMWKSGSLAVII